jgi:glycosyltransferase involved in cell wall biosynthesis
MYPTVDNPSFGTFVKRQVEALSRAGCQQDVIIIESRCSRIEYLTAIYHLRRLVRSGRYDLVHAYYGLCGFVAACQSSLPIVVTYCGSDLNPGFAGREKALIRSWIINALSQLAALRATTCIVQSAEMLSRLFSRRTKKKTRILTCGVDRDLFQPGDRGLARHRLGWDQEQPVVLFVCSEPVLPAVKRPELARASMDIVSKRLPETRLEIVAGKAQELLPDYYRAADVLLLTSASEGSPNVVKEALSCNLPVVSTPVGDVPQLLAGLKNCYICEDRPGELAARVMDVLKDGGRTSSQDRMDGFSMRGISAAIMDIYAGICRVSSSLSEPSAPVESPVP